MDFEYMVNVKFRGNPTLYAYLTNIPDLKAGDHVVVDTPSNGYTVVTVATRYPNQGPYLTPTAQATKPIVCKVYDDNYKNYLVKRKVVRRWMKWQRS